MYCTYPLYSSTSVSLRLHILLVLLGYLLFLYTYLSNRPDDIKIVTRWQTKQTFIKNDTKAPTQLVYAPRMKSDQADRKVLSWGYGIDPKQEPLKWFKLCLEQKKHLHPNVQKSDQLAKAERMLNDKGKTATDATADYLRQLWRSIKEDLGRQCGATAVRGLLFHVILTVPAMWLDSAQNNTRTAAKQAGILELRLCGATTLDLIPEPEAAALATLAEFNDRAGVQTNDVITVCDCGGATEVRKILHHLPPLVRDANTQQDITSYLIQNINPMYANEAVNGDGKMCGAIF